MWKLVKMSDKYFRRPNMMLAFLPYKRLTF